MRRASGSACHRLYPHGPPAPVLATAASRCRREGLSGIHSGRGIPASCSLAANFRRAARSEEAWPARGTRGLWTSVLHPRGSLFGCTAQRSAAVGCVPGPCIVSCSEPQPPLKSAINFPSLLRPARPRASPRLLTRRAPLAAPELRPPARARPPHPEPRTPFPVASQTVALTPAGRPDREMPALTADAMALAAMAAGGIPRGAGGRPQKIKRALGECPSSSCVSTIPQRAGTQPQPPACSEPRPEAATHSGSRKAHRLGEATPSVGFKRPLSAPGVAERFLRSSVSQLPSFICLPLPRLGSHLSPSDSATQTDSDAGT